MRVISGSLKGRNIKGYDILGTRPTMDRVKESVFGMIQDSIKNSIVLDLFAGTGNYGIECISNGSNLVYFNDYNKKCVKIIKDNLIEFQVIEKGILTNFDYIEALNYYHHQNIQFDLVFLDPPYKDNIISDILYLLNHQKLLKDNSLIICELNQKIDLNLSNFSLYKERWYGNKLVLIFKYHIF